MKKTILSVALIMAATVSFAQQVKVLDSGTANNYVVKVFFSWPSGLEAVDLGLPSGTKWANMNIGATSPADYGSYFMWGYTEDCSNTNCSDENCKTYGKSIEDWQDNAEYDAAAANWGSDWVTPDSTQIQELKNSCAWEWTTQQDSEGNDIYGYKVSSKTNGNSIFLPAAGCRLYTYFDSQGSIGYYWSSSPKWSDANYAYHLYFGQGFETLTNNKRNDGFPVRPVLK